MNKTITIADIRELEPCYDPDKYLSEDWQGTLTDILGVKECPPGDRIWVVTQLLDDKTNRLFAVWCARQALALVDNPDPRSIAACDVAERFAYGEATREELLAARDAAWDAAWVAAWDAAWVAARNAVWYAARDAARDAAWDAARYAARYAAWANQLAKLKEMIKACDGGELVAT